MSKVNNSDFYASQQQTVLSKQDMYEAMAAKNPALAQYILKQVRWNLERNIATSNKRGAVIYNLLKVLFESADTTNKIDLVQQLGINSIYGVDYNSLKDDSGRVVQQVFFLWR